MNALLLQFLAFASALALALPPGACAGMMRLSQEGSKSVKATCCHQPAPDHRPNSDQPPNLPSAKCCCVKDATVPEKTAPQADELSLGLPLVAADLLAFSNFGSGADRIDLTAPFHAGPRLHLLKCVWRN
jgi:hypothetical protein